MDVRFWGVRGSIAVGGPHTIQTGGNTSCVELTCDGARLILDGGTGLRALGEAHGRGPLDAAVLFSHVHWDHIQGVPFFNPLFHPDSRLTFVGGSGAGGIHAALAAQMRPPTFPVTLDVFQAQLAFRDLGPGEVFEHGPFRVTPLALHHPDGVYAYRVDAGGRSVVYATDNELDGRDPPAGFVELCEGADLLVLDAQYTADEYRGEVGPSRVGWGHSSWEAAVALGRRAGAELLALFHHDPARSDDGVARIEAAARQQLAGAFAAREGARVTL